MTTPTSPAPGRYRWHHELKHLFVLALERCRTGEDDPAKFFTPDQTAFLTSIGQTPQEIYDFADDHTRYDGDPDWETVLLISAARRDYFLTVQHGQRSKTLVSMDELPAKSEQLGGIPWLRRAIKKAEAKLRGEMPDELMYDCAGDRKFFRERGLHPADFLRHTWVVDGDETKMLEYVRSASAAPAK